MINTRQLLAWLMFWRRGEEDSNKMPRSIVMLTRKAHTFTKEELIAAAELGWGKKFDGVEDPMWFVTVSDVLTILKAGKYVVQLVQVSQPYSDDLETSAKNLTREEQKRAWFEHHAWFSLDLWNDAVPSSPKPSKKEAYAVLARFSRQLGDANCCAIYFPNEGLMLPNDGNAEDELRRLIEALPQS
jgi:hypothetical protein